MTAVHAIEDPDGEKDRAQAGAIVRRWIEVFPSSKMTNADAE
jgi:hypothetical protein